MSASAGRVLILLKGEYNSATSYQMLDAVRYNGSLYIAKKATLGNVPQDGENWMLCASGATWGDIGGIITNQTDLMNLLNGKQNTLTFDTVPTASSTNPVTSAGIKTAVDAKITNPTGGSVGDVLRKTANGEAWTSETESAWGNITGNIDSQTDLKTKLDASASNIATIESTAFASKAYVEGEFLTYNGQLYEVIAAIALGEALVIGTNIEAKSVSDKFVSINSEIETLNKGLTYKAGDSVSLNGAQIVGRATMVGTDAYVSVILPKPISANSVSVTMTSANVFGVDGSTNASSTTLSNVSMNKQLGRVSFSFPLSRSFTGGTVCVAEIIGTIKFI
jgi:hypothetical protein